MKTTTISGAVALALALLTPTGCVTDEPATGTAASGLGLHGGGAAGNHFYWAAYEKQPYIYKGCPDPGPEPWAEAAVLFARRGTSMIELELGTAVPLTVRPLSLPRGMSVMPNSRGMDIAVGDPYGDPLRFTFQVDSGACSYQLEAAIVFE